MRDSTVALRYARALFEAAGGSSAQETVQRQLQKVVRLLDSDQILFRILHHPLLPVSLKMERLARALGGRMFDFVERFIRLVLVKKRLKAVPEMSRLYDQLILESKKKRVVQVKSAVPLSPNYLRQLEQSLGRVWKGTFQAETTVDPVLIGGFVMKWGDRVWDFSIQEQLRRLKENLLESASNN